MAGVDINQVFPQAMVKEGDRDLLVSSTTLYMLLGTVHPYAYQVGEESEAIKHQGHALNLHASQSPCPKLHAPPTVIKNTHIFYSKLKYRVKVADFYLRKISKPYSIQQASYRCP